MKLFFFFIGLLAVMGRKALAKEGYICNNNTDKLYADLSRVIEEDVMDSLSKVQEIYVEILQPTVNLANVSKECSYAWGDTQDNCTYESSNLKFVLFRSAVFTFIRCDILYCLMFPDTTYGTHAPFKKVKLANPFCNTVWVSELDHLYI